MHQDLEQFRVLKRTTTFRRLKGRLWLFTLTLRDISFSKRFLFVRRQARCYPQCCSWLSYYMRGRFECHGVSPHLLDLFLQFCYAIATHSVNQETWSRGLELLVDENNPRLCHDE